ncbi:MAG TPA: IS3 family transposase [Acidimicrobiales bacterium]|nr:IS3 family transposase [Acidimicrobiales bacterium]
MSAYPFIEAEKVEHRNATKACELLEVSRSAFYDWQEHRPCRRQLDDEALARRIEEIYAEKRRRYGWPRVHAQLRREGYHVGGKRVARIMRQRGLIGRCRRRWTKTTISDPQAAAVDLIGRVVGPGTVEIDRVYVGDITYIWTWEGWVYLATVIDLASRRVVGWSMAEHMRVELVCDALRMAIDARRPGARVDLPLRPRHPVHLGRVPPAPRGQRHGSELLETPSVLGQRGGRELVRIAQRGMHPPVLLAHPGSGPSGGVRIHRGLLQPPAAALEPGVQEPGGVRGGPQLIQCVEGTRCRS